MEHIFSYLSNAKRGKRYVWEIYREVVGGLTKEKKKKILKHLKRNIEENFRFPKGEESSYIRCIRCKTNLKTLASLSYHIISLHHNLKCQRIVQQKKQEKTTKKRRYREQAVENAIIAGIPIPALIKLLDVKLFGLIQNLSEFVPLKKTTCYDLSHSISRRKVIDIRKYALSGMYSVILDKSCHRGKNILAIMAYSEKGTFAVGYVDLAIKKQATMKESFEGQLRKAYQTQYAAHQRALKESGEAALH
ncbi:hypothetical protein ADUPG1_012795 [Aduncisulcus paluster]|uniref:C2H2-type domain-containing protein n=1 Tax=Aduncisulcus paluster TaxID=2918883 RepID=A0ABQ5K1E6_9EUKA|nr:hypothetical protein ADUPG1_012795 [Aduncisulcus paluster]